MSKYRVKLNLEYEIDIPELDEGAAYTELIDSLSDESFNKISRIIYETIQEDEYITEDIVSIIKK